MLGSYVDYFDREREDLVVLHKCYRREIVGAVFDVGRVSWFERGLLHENFSLIVLRRS